MICAYKDSCEICLNNPNKCIKCFSNITAKWLIDYNCTEVCPDGTYQYAL